MCFCLVESLALQHEVTMASYGRAPKAQTVMARSANEAQKKKELAHLDEIALFNGG